MQGYPDDGVKILHEKKTKETRILERSLTVLFVNPKWFVPAMAPVEMPIGLNHLHSAFCWCGPIIDTDNSVDSNLSQPLRKVREFGEAHGIPELPNAKSSMFAMLIKTLTNRLTRTCRKCAPVSATLRQNYEYESS